MTPSQNPQSNNWFDVAETTPPTQENQPQESNNWFDDTSSESDPKQQSNFVDRLLTDVLTLGKNTAVGMYELGLDSFNLLKDNNPEDYNFSEQGFSRGKKNQKGTLTNLYETAKSVGKGSLSSSTFGLYEGGKPVDEKDRVLREWGKLLGYGKIVSKGSKLIKNALTSFLPEGIASVLGLGGSFAGYNATQQVQELATADPNDPKARKTLDASEMASHFILGASTAAVLKTPEGIDMLNEMRPSMKLKTLKSGIPPNLPPSVFNHFVEDFVPRLRQSWVNEFKLEAETARTNLQIEYEAEIQATEAKYNKYIDELTKENKLNAENAEAAEAQVMEENQARTLEYQEKLQQLEAEEAQAQAEFEEANRAWDQYVQQCRQIEEAIEMRARHDNTNDLGFRESAPTATIPTTRNTVGNLISQNEITNPTDAGRSLKQIVESTAENERRPVTQAYELSEQLNAPINDIAPTLTHWLHNEIAEIEAIPQGVRSSPTNSLLNSYRSMLQQIAAFDENGNVTAYQPIPNSVLLESAKELRNKVDYDFQSGNPTAVFQRYIDELQNQAETNAMRAGNQEAYDSNIRARTLHREWKNRYDHDFIKQLRDVSKRDYQASLDKSLSVDNFGKLQPILNMSNPGGNLASAIQRSIVQDHLKQAIENPNRFTAETRQLLLNDLKPITTLEQRTAINDALKIAQRETPATPTAPKIKERPKAKPIKELPKKPSPKEPEPIKLPAKPKLKETPLMKHLEKKLSMKPEEIYAEIKTPSGIVDVKNRLFPHEIKALRVNRVKDIIYGDKINEPKTGKEIYDRVNQKANYDQLVEWIGKEETDMFLKKAKEIGDKPAPKSEFEKMYGRDRILKLFGWSAGVLFDF